MFKNNIPQSIEVPLVERLDVVASKVEGLQLDEGLEADVRNLVEAIVTGVQE